MRREDFNRFGLAISACAELYGKTVSEGALTLWWQALEPFDIESVERAFRAVVCDPDSGQFMPRPADIVRKINGTHADRALIAWGKVMDAAARVGAYQSVVFDDGAIHAAIEDLGGWVKLCRSDTDELQFTQKRFCDSYRAYTNRGEFAYPARLVGESEQVNALNGKKTPAPTFIGDAKKAQQIASTGTMGPKTAITAGDALAGALRLIGREGSAA